MRSLMAIAMVATVVSLAACGSSSSSRSPTPASPTPNGQPASANTNKALAFARCVRAHGVPTFPDPTGGRVSIQITSVNGVSSVNGAQVNAPAFRSAMQACHTDLPDGGQPPPLSADRKQTMLQYAQCMRSHGVPSFPDPSFNQGRVGLKFAPGSGVNPGSPGFKAADRACHPELQRSIGRGANVSGP